MPETRAALLELYGGADDDGFRDFLKEEHYDLHYAPLGADGPSREGPLRVDLADGLHHRPQRL